MELRGFRTRDLLNANRFGAIVEPTRTLRKLRHSNAPHAVCKAFHCVLFRLIKTWKNTRFLNGRSNGNRNVFGTCRQDRAKPTTLCRGNWGRGGWIIRKSASAKLR
jgi:hypothetical protein